MTGKESGAVRVIGHLRSADGKGVVRMEEHFEVGIDDVWSALTERERLARWYGEVEGELRLGGRFRARVRASGWESDGRVEACEPRRRFLVKSKEPDEPSEDATEVTLSEDGDGTTLVVEQSGVSLELLWAYGAGLQIHVEDLAGYLAGQEPVDAAKRFDELKPAYQALSPQLAADGEAINDTEV
ncbi:MAG: SRPBCC family protein [Actinobacteria bacterium]|nr:SRPBCC family protein [Actinomycetota bacterium]